jgi:hypothetical protein
MTWLLNHTQGSLLVAIFSTFGSINIRDTKTPCFLLKIQVEGYSY